MKLGFSNNWFGKSPYQIKLSDPRWQEKKLDLLLARGPTCEDCNRKRSLEPHHKYYDAGRDPWDYPDDCFKMLCRECHEHTTEAIKSLLSAAGSFNGDQLIDLANGFQFATATKGANQVATVVTETLMNIDRWNLATEDAQ